LTKDPVVRSQRELVDRCRHRHHRKLGASLAGLKMNIVEVHEEAMSPNDQNARPVLLVAVRGFVVVMVFADLLRGGGGFVGHGVLAALLLIAVSECLRRQRAMSAISTLASERDRLARRLTLNEREEFDAKWITWLCLLGSIGTFSRLRAGKFDTFDVGVVVLLLSIALMARFGWLRAVKRDGARLRELQRSLA
jgi:hypothetical protein